MTTPPAKPPRGQLDTSLVEEADDEAVVVNATETSVNTSAAAAVVAVSVEPAESVISVTVVDSPPAKINLSDDTPVLNITPRSPQAEAAAAAAATTTPLAIDVTATPQVTRTSTSPATKTSPEKKKKPAKTSILDMPLIDILRPRSKKAKKEKSESGAAPAKATTTEAATANGAGAVRVESPPPPCEIDANLFRGLDSFDASIKATAASSKKPTGGDVDLLAIDVKATSNELNQPDVEVFIEKEQICAVAATKPAPVAVAQTPAAAAAAAPTQEIFITVDIPNIIDMPKQTYVSPKKVDSWTTDPLPHVQIGAHKIGDNQPASPSGGALTAATVLAVPSPVDLKATAVVSNGVDQAKTTGSSSSSSSSSDYVKLLTTEDKKVVKAREKEMVAYLREQSGYTLALLSVTSANANASRKDLKKQEKLADQLYKRALKIVTKKGRKQPLTYAQLSKKLEKCVCLKSGEAAHIDKCVAQLRESLESDALLAQFAQKPASNAIAVAAATTSSAAAAAHKTKTEQSELSSRGDFASKSDAHDANGPVGARLRRVPSLTWREANERARILFYKGRIPSIHYNEKRDSFRVSMLTHICTQDGEDRTAEVPVNDEDVRRLLNSYGLYWDGESISLLNKSDEIFTSAQKEAYEYLTLLNTQRQQEVTGENAANGSSATDQATDESAAAGADQVVSYVAKVTTTSGSSDEETEPAQEVPVASQHSKQE
jgi:hypothetical protein